jgi:FKBP-type peptidyl-prolyl cis-trans isomerase
MKSGPKVFRVEKSEAESGLHEAVQLLHQGDSARLVLPPHLGFGMVGDGNKIPPRAILVYMIKIRIVVKRGNS